MFGDIDWDQVYGGFYDAQIEPPPSPKVHIYKKPENCPKGHSTIIRETGDILKGKKEWWCGMCGRKWTTE
jgi:hypothetical protein